MDFYNDSKNFSKGDIAGLTLSQEEKSAYAILYAKAEPSSNGSIGTNQAITFLRKSKLSGDILNEIWKLTQVNNILTREGFYKALKYVALAQNNQPVNPHLLYKATPLPIFEGIYLNSNNYNANVNPSKDINDLTISDIEYDKWSNLFYQSKPVNNNISGNTAKDIFLKSGFNTNILAEVWQLVDLEKSGELDLNEFLIAMFIIMRLKDGTIHEVPRAIPSNLWKSVAYNKKSSSYNALTNRNRFGGNNENSFSSNFNSSVSLNRTGGSIPLNVTGGNQVSLNITGGNQIPLNVTGGSIPMNMTGGSINVNKTGGSVSSLNKTSGNSQNNALISSGLGYKTSSFNSSVNNFNSPMLSNHSSSQSLNSGYGNTDYAITPQEKEKYDQLFNKIDIMGNQYITGEQSMDFFLKSGLSTPELAQIWELADMSKVGRLTREEFYIAMHLIRQRKSGMDLPTTLPACLIPPSLRKNSISSIGNNSQIGQINSSFTTGTQNVGSDNFLNSFDSPSTTSTTNKYNNNSSMGFSSLRSNVGNTVENEVNQLRNEIQQMDNSISSMTKDKQSIKGQRDQLEQELKDLVGKKNDLSMKLTQLKISYDSENLMLNDLRNTFAKENQNREAAQAECNQLEEMVKNLRNEKMFIEHDIERSKEEVTQLNNRIKELKNEYSTLKEEVDRLSNEQKHQNDMLNVTRQMTMAEQQKVDQLKQDKMNIQVSIKNASNKESTPVSKQDSKVVNPFEQGDDKSDFFTNPSTGSIHMPQPKGKNAFDDAFDALSARATSIKSEQFNASFDDAFGTPTTAPAKGQSQSSNAFDDAFQVPTSMPKPKQASQSENIFDDAFQVSSPKKNESISSKNAFDDDFDKHAQSIPNAFDDAFNVSSSSTNNKTKSVSEQDQNKNAFPTDFSSLNKNGSIVEDPFASNTNLASTANAFDDAFNVPSESNKKNAASSLNAFDDAFTDANGFDDAFKNANTSTDVNVNANTNAQTAPEGFEVDFNNAFSGNNTNAFEDPFQTSDNTTNKTPSEKPDLAGFSFENASQTQTQTQTQGIENVPKAQGEKTDLAGFSFENAFDTAAAASTSAQAQAQAQAQAPISTSAVPITTDAPQVKSPEYIGDINAENNDSSVEEEDEEEDDNENVEVQEIDNPFDDAKNIEDDEDYMDEEEDDDDEDDDEEEEEESSVDAPETQQQSISIPPPVSVSIQETMPISAPVSAPIPVSTPISAASITTPISAPVNEQSQDIKTKSPHHQKVVKQVVVEEIVEEIVEESIPGSAFTEQPSQQFPIKTTTTTTTTISDIPEQSTQNESISTPVLDQVQSQTPIQTPTPIQPPQQSQQPQTPTQTQIQPPQQSEQQAPTQTQIQPPQPEQQQVPVTKSENPFENEEDVFNDENAFETDFNSAFENMAITNNNENQNNQPSDGNMVKSNSNNSMKFDNFDIDKEFQQFNFDKESNINSTNAQNLDNNINNSFDEEFKTGFDENDFNFDTTFVNNNISNAKINQNQNQDQNQDQNQNQSQNQNQNSNMNTNFDAFAEQSSSTAHFNTNFDDAFNFDNFYDKNDQQKQTDAFMDEAFGVSNVSPATGNNSVFDNNFNDFGNDPFTAFDTNANTASTPNVAPTNPSAPTSVKENKE